MSRRRVASRALVLSGVLALALAIVMPAAAVPLLPEGDGPAVPEPALIEPTQPAPVVHAARETQQSSWTPALVGGSIGVAVALFALAASRLRRPAPPQKPQPARF
jgi:hypothetical protein